MPIAKQSAAVAVGPGRLRGFGRRSGNPARCRRSVSESLPTFSSLGVGIGASAVAAAYRELKQPADASADAEREEAISCHGSRVLAVSTAAIAFMW